MSPVSSANRTSRTAPLAHVVWRPTRVVASQTKQRPPRRPSRRRCARRRLPPPSRARTPPSHARRDGRPRRGSPGRGSSRRSRRRPPGARRPQGFPRSPRLEPRHPVAAPDVDRARRVDGDERATVEPGGACGARLGPVAGGDDHDRRGAVMRSRICSARTPKTPQDGRLADGALLWPSSTESDTFNLFSFHSKRLDRCFQLQGRRFLFVFFSFLLLIDFAIF